MFRDSEAIDDGGAFGFTVKVRGGNEIAGVDAAGVGDHVRRVTLDHGGEFVKAFGARADKVFVDEPRVNQFADEPVGKSDVGAGREL